MRTISGGRAYRVDAIILKRISIGETDRVVTLFTRDRGKLGAVAKGARGPKSRLAGSTEPFTAIRALLAQGQSLDVLTQAEVRQSFPAIRKDLVRIGYASYLLELVDAGTEERQSLPLLWDALWTSLHALATTETPDVVARAFEMKLMQTLGYEPALYGCVLDQAPLQDHGAAFHPLRGGTLCPRCARSVSGSLYLSMTGLASLRALAGEPIARAVRFQLPESVRQELRRAMVPYIRHHLETNLHSLQFLDDVTLPLVIEAS